MVIIGSGSGSIYCDILGSYGCNCNEHCLLECDTLWYGRNLAIFWSTYPAASIYTVDSYFLQMKAAGFYDMAVNSYQTTQHHI